MNDALDRGRWRRIAALLDELLELPAAERSVRLADSCAGDPGLRTEIEALLEIEGQPGLLDSPAGDCLATLIREAEAGRGGGSAAPPTPGQDPAGWHSPGSRDARFLPGTLLAGRYRIVNRLGRGGMGEVFRADDLKLGQTVALKFLPPELTAEEALRARFLNEVKLARLIAHPNVCRVYDVGEAQGQLFLSMEHIKGEDLASLLKRIGRVPREKATQIAQQLCAGLAAAHGEGILHRDLKPANVMLDDRGQVRITDFGLAGVGEELEGAEILAGTPAYMAPEQLSGEGVSARSDLYALGLLLYELFTGHRAFEGRAQDQRRSETATPAAPSSLVAGIDPAVERVILRCLDRDPAGRPESAAEVASELPGADPLATALAAGETPSPEMVAAAGPRGSLSPRVALAVLVANLAGLVLVAALGAPSSLVGRVPFDKPVAVLAGDVRELLVDLGHDQRPVDAAYSLVSNHEYRRYLAAQDTSPNRWRPLSAPGQLALVFRYRQSLEPMAPLDWVGTVRIDDPAPRAGDVLVETDLRGKLRRLEARAPVASGGREARPADWSALLEAAGFEAGELTPVEPVWPPPVFAEQRAAWQGVLRAAGDLPVRVEAGWYLDRPAYFKCLYPFDPEWELAKAAESAWEPAPRPFFFIVLWSALLLSTVAIGAILTVRNLRLGRGDRKGAARVAAAVLLVRFGWWLFGGHHVARFWSEVDLLGTTAGRSVFSAAVAWCFYVALEPFVRRIWPGTLISWSRLLAGRRRDPLVGRDLLFGVSCGLALTLAWDQLYVLIPHWLSWQQPPMPSYHPFWPFFGPTTDPLLGSRYAVAAVAATWLGSLWGIFAYLLVLVGLLGVVRKKWLVFPLFAIFCGANGWVAALSDFSPLGLALGLFGGVLFLVVLSRWGLLAVVVGLFTAMLFMVFPVTSDPTAHYFATSLLALGIVGALAAYGCWVSLSGRRLSA